MMFKKSPQTQVRAKRVLAIDPGFGRAGVAVLERDGDRDILLYSSCIVTEKTEAFIDRLQRVVTEVEVLLEKFGPELMALERLYFATNQKTAMQVSEVRGALLSLAGKHHLSVVEYTPLQVKIAITGFGRSGKRELMRMIPLLIEMPKSTKRLDDEYDAIGIGITALAAHRPSSIAE